MGPGHARLLEQSRKNVIAANRIIDSSLPVPGDRIRPGQPAVAWQPGLVLNAGANQNEIHANLLGSNGFGLFRVGQRDRQPHHGKWIDR